ncbi:hypothetical protein CERSUDRAFT_95996 [Gelatoporia subvermispora B]|uniref:FAD-binding domain-containing protein n=1 Tax=Ceriporiopsis subvermispora (strain B) TaxID=914234 RepID=M2QFE2_CERS8|nr:hypothetical protein CERSUDRAFT_95996 [Gelatoporia subvermispora B]
MARHMTRVAIIGGGIGGLMLAVALHRLSAPVEVDVYESTAQFTELGAGIGMSNRVWEIMEWLDLADDLRPLARSFGEPIHHRKADQAEGIDLSTMLHRGVISFHRVDLQSALCKNLPSSVRVHFSKRLSSYIQSDTDGIEIHFQDDSIANCDVLVGCDGIRSTVRSIMLNALAADMEKAGQHVEAAAALSGVKPQWTGTVFYRSLIPRDAFVREFPNHRALSENMIYIGKGKHFIGYTIGTGDDLKVSVGGVVGNPDLEGSDYNGPWVAPGSKDEVMRHFAHFEPEVRALASYMDEPLRWALHVIPPLPTHVHDKVALLGDAAHAMVPYQGAGAGQAIEDAYILASVLAHPGITMKTLPVALQVYNEIRRPFVQEVQRKSRESGLLLQFNTADFSKFTAEESALGAIDASAVDTVGRRQEELTAWFDDTSLQADVERAKELLNERLGAHGKVSWNEL